MVTITLIDNAFKKKWGRAVCGPLWDKVIALKASVLESQWFKLCSCRVSRWDSHYQALHCWRDTATSSPLKWGSPWLMTASGKSTGFPGPQCPSQQSLWARASKSSHQSGRRPGPRLESTSGNPLNFFLLWWLCASWGKFFYSRGLLKSKK